jgi:hypothetical protein
MKKVRASRRDTTLFLHTLQCSPTLLYLRIGR